MKKTKAFPYCIGLTGRIASGKSTVAALFNELGATVINADQVAKQLTTNDHPALKPIVHYFSPLILTETGELDRAKLRQRIVIDPTARRWLENYLHPLIRQHIEARLSKVDTAYCVIEIPLLNDRQDYPYLDRILLVKADEIQRLQRLIARDKSSESEARAILATQPGDAAYAALADDILINSGTVGDLKQQIDKLYERWANAVRNKHEW